MLQEDGRGSRDLKRGERRHRSRTKFMRRLRVDWNSHGWRWHPLYYTPRVRGRTFMDSPFEQTTLCRCFFDPTPKGSARFRDTPTWHRSEAADRRAEGRRYARYELAIMEEERVEERPWMRPPKSRSIRRREVGGVGRFGAKAGRCWFCGFYCRAREDCPNCFPKKENRLPEWAESYVKSLMAAAS